MDTELLVDNRVDDGQKLVWNLAKLSFDVSVAFWVKTSEEGLWFLYIGSASLEPSKIADAYRTLYSCLKQIPGTSLSISELKLIQVGNPIAQDAIAIRDRHPGRLPVRFHGDRLGNMSIDEAYIYPRVGGQMSSAEILHTVFGIINNRKAGAIVRPSTVNLRSGAAVSKLITGINTQADKLTIHVLDPISNAAEQIKGDDVISIQG